MEQDVDWGQRQFGDWVNSNFLRTSIGLKGEIGAAEEED